MAAVATTLCVLLALLPPVAAQTEEEEPRDHATSVLAGVGHVDASWHVGASAGQYATTSVPITHEGGDPHTHSTRRAPSYGVQSRLDVRALLVAGKDAEGNSTRVAFVKNDLYIPQDLLNQRVGQILKEHDAAVGAGLVSGEPTGIDHSNLVIAVSHNHSSPYYSSPSWGLWAFQDVMDLRFFEYMAQKMAESVIEAAGSLVPVRMGAATVYWDATRKHSFGPAIADDRTPAGYPRLDNDQSISVLRFDDISDPNHPRPLANYTTFGQHPEFLEGNNLITGEWIAPFQRFTDAETGALNLFAQNNTGTSESDARCQTHPCSERAEFDHREYAQAERGARRMADTFVAAWHAIGAATAPTAPEILIPSLGNAGPGEVQVVPFSSDFVVDVNDKQFAPPYSHPYPSVSNCRTDEAAHGRPGVPVVGLPDCERPSRDRFFEEFPYDPGTTYEELKRAGVPIPANYGAPGYTGLEETFQIHLQAVRLGEVLLTICPCEQWADQSRNIKTRADKVHGNMWIGFNWSCEAVNPPDGTWDPETGKGDPDAEPERPTWLCSDPGRNNFDRADGAKIPVTDFRYHRMRAQVNNDASGWDAGFERCPGLVTGANQEGLNNEGVCPLAAESEPVSTHKIKGNFTQSPFIPPEWQGAPFPAELDTERGYSLVVPVSMANDYWGYIASYREYQRGDHYRKALTGMGQHSSDFLATRLVTMGGHLKDPAGFPDYPYNALDLAYMADGAHQEARAAALGHAAQAYLDAYESQLPTDGGTPAPVVQPKSIQRFDVATFEWVGGNNYVDNPTVVVQRCVRAPCEDDDDWVDAFGQSGEVQTTIDFPEPEDLPLYRVGQFQWRWTAYFEAFDSDIDTATGADAKCPATYDFPTGWTPRCSQVPDGIYRFLVRGHHRTGPVEPDAPASAATEPYLVTSDPFEVTPWEGITVNDLAMDGGSLTFQVGPRESREYCPEYPRCGEDKAPKKTITLGPIAYPDTWPATKLPERPETGAKTFPRVHRTYINCENYGYDETTSDGRKINRCETWNEEPKDYTYCFSCTFRPWISVGQVDTATVTILNDDGASRTEPASCDIEGNCTWPGTLYIDEVAYVDRGGIVDTFGEINGSRSAEVRGTEPRPVQPAPPVEPGPPTDPGNGGDPGDPGNGEPGGGGGPGNGGGNTPTPQQTQTSAGPRATEARFTDRSSESGQYSDDALFEAQVTTDDGAPVPGGDVTFELRGSHGVRSFTAVTDASGVAATRVSLVDLPGAYALTARFEPTAALEGSADLTNFVVEKERARLSLDVARRYVSATLADRDAAGGPVFDQTVRFFADRRRVDSDKTNRRGVAVGRLPRRFWTGRHSFRARFRGNDFYLPARARRR
ncbi:MAG: hypothetical protein M3N53_02660 [Actinomycetota bacterium]|nr:hypothetical protein [Actinomycetota bacterium]